MDKNKQYQKKAEKASPPSPKVKNMLMAFLFGGLICTIGQCFNELYKYLGADKETASTLVAVTLIVIAAILTGIGVFDKIAKLAGAGTLVPITGFSNAVTCSALEFSSEGKIYGTGAKMFNIAGPVIVYGCAAASIYGIIYYVCGIIK